jgi:EAL domain-containing protein (putative c-di-GMP-specific phosphodiesterase class I)
VYQPIVHLDTGTISGVEALCRFHDTRPPDLWFLQCRELGLAAEMDFAIIGRALEDLDLLPDAGYLAVNVALDTLAMADRLAALLQPATRMRPIVVELTEHAAVHDYDTVIQQARILSDAGIRLAVDDAGAGYSTFQHVLRLHPDIIKLDRSITESIDQDPARHALATAMVIFAGEIGAAVVAEGIETDAELAAVRSAGIARGQGFGIGVPAPPPITLPAYTPRPFLDLDAEAAADEGPTIPFADLDPAVAVVAHGLLSSLASVQSALRLLGDGEREIPIEQHRALCAVMQRQLAQAISVLKDLVRGLGPEALVLLDGLERPR